MKGYGPNRTTARKYLRTILVDEIHKCRGIRVESFDINNEDCMSDFNVFDKIVDNRKNADCCTCLVKFTEQNIMYSYCHENL